MAGGPSCSSTSFTPAALRLLGCAIGFVGGSYIFPKILWHAYNIMYGFGIPIEFVLDGKLAAISVATYLLCALGATYLVCRGFLREVPAELIRPKAPKEGPSGCCWSASPSCGSGWAF